MELEERETIAGVPTGDYVSRAADAFTREALDDMRWAGDTEGRGLNPLDLHASSWAPVTAWDVAGAYTDDAESPEAQVRNLLENERAADIADALGITPERFGALLYLDQNGHGTGFWDQNFSEPQWGELSGLVSYHTWQVSYDYDPAGDPDGDHVQLYVTN